MTASPASTWIQIESLDRWRWNLLWTSGPCSQLLPERFQSVLGIAYPRLNSIHKKLPLPVQCKNLCVYVYIYSIHIYIDICIDTYEKHHTIFVTLGQGSMQFAIFTVMLTFMVTVTTCICVLMAPRAIPHWRTHCYAHPWRELYKRSSLTETKTQSKCTQGPTCPRESRTAHSSSKLKFQEIEVPELF